MGMKEFIIRRTIQTVIIFFIMITFNFFLFRIMPGDPTAILVGNPNITQETRERIIQQFGLDKPLWMQYILYIRELFRGDLGVSFYFTGEPVVKIILGQRMINTLVLMGSATALSVLIGFITGVVSAWRRGTKLDISGLIISIVFFSTPSFWLGLVILLVAGYYLHLIPLGGTITRGLAHANVFHYIADYLHHLIAPMITLTLVLYGGYYLMMRNSMLETLTQEFIVTAKAKGLPEKRIMFKHAARNAMLPLVSMVAVNAALIVGGAIVTETVFSWHGIGSLMFLAVASKDYPVLQGIFLIISITVLLANFIADILYAVSYTHLTLPTTERV